MIDKVIIGFILLLMVIVVFISMPIALVSVAWEVGKEIRQGKKPKIWGIG